MNVLRIACGMALLLFTAACPLLETVARSAVGWNSATDWMVAIHATGIAVVFVVRRGHKVFCGVFALGAEVGTCFESEDQP